jgi:hypothetical protein
MKERGVGVSDLGERALDFLSIFGTNPVRPKVIEDNQLHFEFNGSEYIDNYVGVREDPNQMKFSFYSE